MVYRRKAVKKGRRRYNRQTGAGTFKGSKRQRGKKQKGGFAGGLAAGMMIPALLGTVGQILKINV